MRVAVTGTPGTGKTSAVEALVESEAGVSADLEVVHLNDLIEPEGLAADYDEARDSHVVDLEAVADYLAGRTDLLIESHLAHHLDVDRVVVLRCAPGELERRLRHRGVADPAGAENEAGTTEHAESEASIGENAESEALDVILGQALERHGRDAVYEIETTDREPAAVAEAIRAAIAGDREPGAGTVDYSQYLL